MGLFTAIWEYLLLSAPYLILGFFASGIIKAFISDNWIQKQIGGRGFLPTLKATIIGIPLPLCSCSVIPTTITLKKAGASNSSASAFVISTPETGLDSMAMTYGLINLPMTILRVITAFVTAITAGVFQSFFNNEEIAPPEEEKKSCCSKSKKAAPSTVVGKFLTGQKYAFIDLVDDIAPTLTFGLIVGALINWLLPAEIFHGLNPHLGRLAIIGIGIPLYICATSSTPIAASLILKGMSPGTALLFLTVGPATNISNLLILQKYIGKKGVLINTAVIIVTSLIISYLADSMIDVSTWNIAESHMHHHDHSAGFIPVASSVILIILILKSLYKTKIKKLF